MKIKFSLLSFNEMGFSMTTINQLVALNIPKVKALCARQIKKLKERENVSHGVFAVFLNVSPSTLQNGKEGRFSL